jgi:hypothetical protein
MRRGILGHLRAKLSGSPGAHLTPQSFPQILQLICPVFRISRYFETRGGVPGQSSSQQAAYCGKMQQHRYAEHKPRHAR